VKHVNIFTQSSVKSPTPQKGKIIFLLESIYNDQPYTKHFIEEVEGNWNETSLDAVRLALQKLKEPAEIVIWTDCPYIELNIERAKEWRKENYEHKGAKRKYFEKWEEIFTLLEGSTYKVTTGQNEYTHWLISELKK
jgi:ribonuclease HI